MRVESSAIALAAGHSERNSFEVQEHLEIRAPSSSSVSNASDVLGPDSADYIDVKVLLARFIYEFFTGRKAPRIAAMGKGAQSTVPAGGKQSAKAAPTWSISYSRTEIRRESESSVFSARGAVTLDTGKQIDFSLDLHMNRELTVINGAAVRAGNMSDPIVVNLDGAGARLTPNQQAFDLNSDGVDEAIATLAAGSAWLARDANANGQVDNGRELFGPSTGSGFGELATLDEDHNHWIDEGDAAYNQLGLWNGSQFTSLREAGIGALSVDTLATPFALKDGTNQLGQIQRSGVYLNENGTPGALQQVDLRV